MKNIFLILFLTLSIISNAQTNYVETLLNGESIQRGYTTTQGLATQTPILGSVVTTTGFYTMGDGGGNTFLITNSGKTQNGTTVITTADGLTAESFLTRKHDVLKWGFKNDGVTDNLAAWNLLKTIIQVGDIVEFSGGQYYFSDEIALPLTCTIRGQGYNEESSTELIFKENKNGIIVGINMGRTHLHNFKIYAENDNGSTGIGIQSNSLIYVENISIKNFPEKGLYIRGNTVTSEGNANHSVARNLSFRFIGRNTGGIAMHISGGDANNCAIENCTVLDCGNGYLDECTLGNHYVTCHSEGNGTGGYHYKTDNGNNRTVFSGCYAETGNDIVINTPSIWIGGTLGNTSAWLGTGHYEYIGSGKLFTNKNKAFSTETSASRLELFSNENDEAFRFYDRTLGTNNYYEFSLTSNGPAFTRNGFDAGKGLVLLSERNSAKFGADRPIAPEYGLWLPNGMLLGERFEINSQKARMWSMGETAPTSGEWASGDKQWNINYDPFVQGSVEYWQCITGGSPGTWEAIYASINNTGVSTINTTSTVSGSKVYLIDSSGGAITLTISDLDNRDGNEVVVKDLGSALTNNVTIQLESGTIDGAASQSLTTNFSSFTLVFNGGNAFII